MSLPQELFCQLGGDDSGFQSSMRFSRSRSPKDLGLPQKTGLSLKQCLVGQRRRPVRTAFSRDKQYIGLLIPTEADVLE